MWPQYWDFFVQSNLKVTNLMSSIRSLFGFTSCFRLSVQCQQECSCHFDKVHRQRGIEGN